MQKLYLTRIPLGVILARTFSIGANPGAYVIASDHGGGIPSARCYPPSARVSVRRPRDDMHRARRPFIRMSVDLEVAHHGPETREHETVFFKGEKRQLPVQEPRVGIRIDVGWVEVQEDADFLGDVAVAVRFVLPVAFVDDGALGELSEPFDHLRAHADGEYSGSLAVVEAVVLGDEEVLVAFAAGDPLHIWTWWPPCDSVSNKLLTQDDRHRVRRCGNRDTYLSLVTSDPVFFAGESGSKDCTRFEMVPLGRECARVEARNDNESKTTQNAKIFITNDFCYGD